MSEKQTCPGCGELLETCETCGATGCPECNADGSNGWYRDEEGIHLCPVCHAAAKEEYNRATANGIKVCESCTMVKDDESDGEYGYCEFHHDHRRSTDYCEDRIAM